MTAILNLEDMGERSRVVTLAWRWIEYAGRTGDVEAAKTGLLKDVAKFDRQQNTPRLYRRSRRKAVA